MTEEETDQRVEDYNFFTERMIDFMAEMAGTMRDPRMLLVVLINMGIDGLACLLKDQAAFEKVVETAKTMATEKHFPEETRH